MKNLNRIVLIAMLGPWLPVARGEPITLNAADARLTGSTIKLQNGNIAFWRAGESAEWTFSASEVPGSFLVITYSTPADQNIEAWLDGEKHFTTSLPGTTSWTQFEELSFGKLQLAPGKHTLRLTAPSGKGYCINLKAAGLTDTPPTQEILFTPESAILSEPKVKKSNEISSWKPGESIYWNFTANAPLKKQLHINYSAAQPATLEYSIPGMVTNTVYLKKTDGLTDYRTVKIADLDLPPGSYALHLINRSQASLINLKQAEITTKNPPPFSYEFPAIYSNCTAWAATMTALRQTFRNPEVQQARMHCGKQIDLYLNKEDGKAFWTDFPRETDWFLQDNQLHGEWGRGYFDARQDYKNYLDPSRDNTLEKKLIARVLEEIKSAALQKQFDILKSCDSPPDNPAWLMLYERACRVRRQLRLDSLLKETDKIIYATHHNMGKIYLETETQGCPDGSQLRIIDLTPEKEGLPLKDELLFDSKNGIVRDPELSFDGKKLLFAWRKTNKEASTNGKLAPATGNYKIYEMDLAMCAIRPLTDDTTYGADIEPCYLPNGDIMFSSMRCVQEVTCGWGDCSNLYIMDKDGNYARRIGFDQTQTAFPHLLNDGRVIYTRRDYNDRGQSYAHGLFVMNADGTSQTEYYGNNDMAPTSIQHTRPIPGSHKTMGVAGGYHTSQGGKLVIVDPSKGRQNYTGLTFYNWEPTPLDQVNDENYCRVGEQYTYPYPFSENSLLVSFSPIGAYLTSDKGTLDKKNEATKMFYNLYYMTLDGRRELLAANPALSCTQAIPVRSRPIPPVRASSVDYTRDGGICYVQDVYYGPAAQGIARGTIKKIRVVTLFYKPITIGAGGWRPDRKEVGPGRKYAGYGWHSVLPTGVGSASFDTKEILGEIDVNPDGSAMFEVPARTPIYFQLIDENGLVVQTMRSWATLMPNENFSCVGCHEKKDSAPLPQAQKTMAMQQAPQKLQPVHDISGAPFSYAKKVQPIWNKHCVSCHAPDKPASKIDLSDTIVSDHPAEKGTDSTRHKFFQSYLTLLHVKWRTDERKPGLDEGRTNQWVNYYTRMATVEPTPPYYAGSTQSGLIKLLQEGHGHTKLTAEEIGTIAAWIDLNVPFVGEYDEMNIWDEETTAKYHAKLGVRHEQERIEQENIKRYIEAGQP